MKRLLLFLETQLDYIGSYEQIENTFENTVAMEKAITDSINKNWVVKISKHQYKLTKTGEYEIQKMTKKQKNEIIVDFKLVKWVRCTMCGQTFPTKGRESWCSNCRNR